MMHSILEACVYRLGGEAGAGGGGRVLCVGLCTLDIVQVVETYPREDSDQRCREARWQRGGNASNNCTVLALLGAAPEYLGTLSRDTHYDFLVNDFNKNNINIEHCVYHTNCEAPLSTVIISLEGGSRTIIHSNASLPELTFEDFKKVNLKNYSWIHFEGRNMSQVQLMMEYVEHWNTTNKDKDGKNKPIQISVDIEKAKDGLLDLIPYADVVFVGKDFATSRKYVNMSETLKNISNDTKEGAIIICAWGDRGAMAKGSDGVTVQSPAFPPKKVVDTLGAGDTFCATVIYSLMNDKTLQESISLGCQVAGAKVGHRGFSSIGKIHKKIFT